MFELPAAIVPTSGFKKSKQAKIPSYQLLLGEEKSGTECSMLKLSQRDSGFILTCLRALMGTGVYNKDLCELVQSFGRPTESLARLIGEGLLPYEAFLWRLGGRAIFLVQIPT